MKKNLYNLIILAIMILLVGCYYAQNKSYESIKSETKTELIDMPAVSSKSGKGYSYPMVINEDIENVKFAAKVIMPSHHDFQAKKYNVDVKTIDNDTVFNKLFAKTEVVKQQTMEMENDDRTMGNTFFYKGSNRETLTITKSSISFYKELYYYVTNVLNLEENTTEYNADLFKQNIDFDFCNRKDALQSIVKELHELGINLEGDLVVHSYELDYNTMKNEEYAQDKDGNIDQSAYKNNWTPEDNSYYFCIWQAIDNLPVAYKYADAFNRIEDSNAPIQVLFSKQGIEMLMVDKVFNFTDSEEKINLANLDSIVECISNKYNELLTTSSFVVKNLDLHAVCLKQNDGKYKLKPAWVVTIYEYPNFNNKYEFNKLQMIVDAEDAMEIIL